MSACRHDRAAVGRRRRRDHGAIVEQIVGEAAVRFLQRTIDDRRAKTAGIDEQVGFEAAAVVADERLRRRRRSLSSTDAILASTCSTRGRWRLRAERRRSVRVEMVAVASRRTGKFCGRQRRETFARERGRNEVRIGMRRNVQPVPPRAGLVKKSGAV